MATALTPRRVTRAGLQFRAADLVAEDGTGNTFVNDGNMWIVVRNDNITGAVPVSLSMGLKGYAVFDSRQLHKIVL